jgi:hypothetical protein
MTTSTNRRGFGINCDEGFFKKNAGNQPKNMALEKWILMNPVAQMGSLTRICLLCYL